MSGSTWHCKQLPNGDNPIVVCERETLQAEIERLRAENVLLDATEDECLAEIDRLWAAGNALAVAYRALGGLDVAFDAALVAWEARK